jgi:hypothetical protein
MPWRVMYGLGEVFNVSLLLRAGNNRINQLAISDFSLNRCLGWRVQLKITMSALDAFPLANIRR